MRLKCKKANVVGIAVCAMLLMAGCQKSSVQNTADTESAVNVERTAETTSAAKAESTAETERTADQENSIDAVSSASQVFYQEASFDQARLWEAISRFEGSCTIATVNADGTPNLIVAVPGTAGDSHLFFNWADNTTKSNIQRTNEAVISYYIYNPEAEEKLERNQGARVRVSLETDPAVLEQLQEENSACSSVSTVLRVEEILPLG